MRTAIRIICLTSIALFLCALTGKIAEAKSPHLFETAWATAIAWTIIGFMLSWVLTAAAVVVRGLFYKKNVDWWIYLWLALGFVVIGIFCGGLFHFLFP